MAAGAPGRAGGSGGAAVPGPALTAALPRSASLRAGPGARVPRRAAPGAFKAAAAATAVAAALLCLGRPPRSPLPRLPRCSAGITCCLEPFPPPPPPPPPASPAPLAACRARPRSPRPRCPAPRRCPRRGGPRAGRRAGPRAGPARSRYRLPGGRQVAPLCALDLCSWAGGSGDVAQYPRTAPRGAAVPAPRMGTIPGPSRGCRPAAAASPAAVLDSSLAAPAAGKAGTRSLPALLASELLK